MGPEKRNCKIGLGVDDGCGEGDCGRALASRAAANARSQTWRQWRQPCSGGGSALVLCCTSVLWRQDEPSCAGAAAPEYRLGLQGPPAHAPDSALQAPQRVA